MWDLGQCDRKKCSGTKLVRHGVLRELTLGKPFPGLVLTPQGKSTVSPSDMETVLSKGIAVVDCSWHRIEEVPFRKFIQYDSITLRVYLLSSVL